MADRVCMTCKYFEYELDENGEDKCMNCMYGSVPNNSKNPYPNWEPKKSGCEEPNEKKESEWYVEAIKEGIRKAEEKSKESGCNDEEPNCFHTYFGWVKEVLTGKDPLFSVEEIHPAIDLILKAALVDAANKQSEMLAMIERHLAQIARKK